MPPVRVRLPRSLLMYWSGPAEVAVEAATVADALGALARRDAGLAARIVDEQGALRPYVHVFVNGDAVPSDALATTMLREGDMIRVLPSVAGGSSDRAWSDRDPRRSARRAETRAIDINYLAMPASTLKIGGSVLAISVHESPSFRLA